MINVPITLFIGLLGVFFTAYFQRQHWLRTTREEIRVREIKAASDLVRDIAQFFDKRIAAQRRLLRSIGTADFDEAYKLYSDTVQRYQEGFNDIRYRLHYTTSENDVLRFENDLNDRLVMNGYSVLGLTNEKPHPSKEISELDSELSKVSAQVYHYCAALSESISEEKIRPLSRIHNWRDPDNPFIGSWFLIRRLFNI